MGVKVREKKKGSGVWWVFVNHRGERASMKIGSQKAARRAASDMESRLALGLELPIRKPAAAVPTFKAFYEDVFLSKPSSKHIFAAIYYSSSLFMEIMYLTCKLFDFPFETQIRQIDDRLDRALKLFAGAHPNEYK